MASSEKVDSGGRSNFSQTCSLLSQYLKEKGSFGELGLGLTPHLYESKETINFLPLIEKSGQNLGPGNLEIDVNILPQLVVGAGGVETHNKSGSYTKPEKETGQMTIFYAGQVIVFDDFRAERVKEIMMLASKSSAAAPHTAFAPPAHRPAAFGIMQERGRLAHHPTLASDLPIARQNSLARFLEKRKDRITANAPYQAQASKVAAASPKTVKTEPWLGLARQPPLQIQRRRH